MLVYLWLYNKRVITLMSATLWDSSSCSQHYNMSRVIRKPTFWFPNWSYTNQAVQLQKMARGLKKFGFRKKRDCTIRVAKTKVLISFPVTAKLICVFVLHMQNVGYRMTRLIYTLILNSGKNDNFRMKKSEIFLIFA